MQEKYADQGLVVVAVNLDQERHLAEQFLERVGANFFVGFDPSAQLAERFEVVGMPMSYLIDRNNIVVARHVGFRRDMREQYENEIVRALASQ